MRAYDALPAELRQWLAGAVLPWSAASVRRVWQKALTASGGDRQAARAALEARERKRLERDIVRLWGEAHPFVASVQDTCPKEVRPPLRPGRR
jgi:hypothetical protein